MPEAAKKMRTFYTLALTQVFSLIGSRMSGIAIGIWLFEETGSTTPLLLVPAFAILPTMLFGSLAGVIADRYNRKQLLILSDAGQAIPTLFLFLTFVTGTFELPFLYIAVMIQALFGMIQGPTATASIVMLVPKEKLDRANTIVQLIGPAAGLIAPLIAALGYVALGVEGVLLIDLITFIGAVCVIIFLTIPQPSQSAESAASRGSFLKELRGGLGFLWSRPALLSFFFGATLVNFLIIGPANLITPYTLSLTDDQRLVGVMLALMNLGMFGGGVLFSIRQPSGGRMRVVLGGLAFLAVMLFLYGMMRTPLLLGLILLLLPATLPMINASFMSLMQLKTPPDMQGRVFAVGDQISVFAMPVSLLLTGLVIDNFLEPAVNEGGWWSAFSPLFGDQAGSGMGLFMSICGVLVMLLTIAMYAYPALRNIERDLPDYVAEPQTPEAEAPEPEPIINPAPAPLMGATD